MIFRGQPYGQPPGEWWTSSRSEAESFAMSRGGNRTYVVLALDEDDPEWLQRFCYFSRSTGGSGGRGDWFRIPLDELRKRWRGVRIVSGAISTEAV